MSRVDFGDREALPAVFATVIIALIALAFWRLLAAPEPVPPVPLSHLQAQYRRAVNLAVWPNPDSVAHNLVQLKPSDTLVTWTNSGSIDCFQKPQLCKLTWITVQPHLQQFCRDFVKANGTDQLDLRLKQRLGLPPDAAYDTFVEFTVEPADFSKIFRPCGTWDPTTSICPAVPGPDVWKANPGITPQALDWLVKNHYSSYATGQPYPWTALGYTFDWAPAGDSGDQFVREGESEFVVPANTAVHFVASVSTADYCKAP